MKKEFNKKTGLIAIAAILVVGSGSAALVNYFGQSTGDVTVQNQALTVSGDMSPSYSVNAAPEITADSITVANNNDDLAVDYKIDVQQSTDSGTSSNLNDFQTIVLEVTTFNEGNSNLDVERSYNPSTDRATFTLTNYDGDTGAIYFDRDGDKVPEFNIGFYDTDATTPRVKVWKNVGGTYEGDTRFDASGEFDSSDVFTSGNYDGKVTGFIGQDKITVRVDAELLGANFQYGVKDNGGTNYKYTGGSTGYDASDDEAQLAASIGTQVAKVDATADTATSGDLQIQGSNFVGSNSYAVISEFGGSTPVDTYSLDVGVTP